MALLILVMMPERKKQVADSSMKPAFPSHMEELFLFVL